MAPELADHAYAHCVAVLIGEEPAATFTACVSVPVGFQAEIDPSRFAKRNTAGPVLPPLLSVKSLLELKTPNGLKAIGYSSSDIPALVEGTLPQHRVTKLSPRPASPDDLSRLFEDAMVAW